MIMHPIFGVNALFEHLPTITRLAIKIVSIMTLAQLDNGNRNTTIINRPAPPPMMTVPTHSRNEVPSSHGHNTDIKAH
jgi:hypothetical protein